MISISFTLDSNNTPTQYKSGPIYYVEETISLFFFIKTKRADSETITRKPVKCSKKIRSFHLNTATLAETKTPISLPSPREIPLFQNVQSWLFSGK